MIIVIDAADIVCGAKNSMWSNFASSKFAPHDKIVCNVEQFVIDKFLHICNEKLLVIAPNDKFTMYAVLSRFTLF